MTMAELLAREITTPHALAYAFAEIEPEHRAAMFSGPRVRAALWRLPKSPLRDRALCEALRGK